MLPQADIYFTVVKTSDAPGHKDMAMIAIPADAAGISFGPRYDTPSYNFLPMSEMYLDKVVVSEEEYHPADWSGPPRVAHGH